MFGLLFELVVLVARLHHEEGRLGFPCPPIKLLHLVHDFEPVQVGHVEIQDQQSKRPMTWQVAALKIFLDFRSCLLAVPDVSHILVADTEDILNNSLHRDDHKIHVVGNENLFVAIANWSVHVFLLCCPFGGILLRTIPCHDFMDVLR